MSEETTGNEGTEEGTTEETGEATGVREPESVEELPKWAQDKLQKANSEAAKYRTEKKNAVEKAKSDADEANSQTITELTQARDNAVNERDSAQIDVLKLRSALNAGIPGESAVEFAERLQGSTQEEIESDAERLKGYFGGRPGSMVDRSQGNSGKKSPALNDNDALLSAITSAVGKG